MRSSLIVSGVLGLTTGCSMAGNPFRDEFSKAAPVTTSSVQAVQAADVAPSVQAVHGVEKVRHAADGSVVHLPLYFEDPMEEAGSEDGQFAWTGEDYWWMVYWRGRFLANLVAFPVSAVVTPPGQAMVSDGERSGKDRGREFDAEPRR